MMDTEAVNPIIFFIARLLLVAIGLFAFLICAVSYWGGIHASAHIWIMAVVVGASSLLAAFSKSKTEVVAALIAMLLPI